MVHELRRLIVSAAHYYMSMAYPSLALRNRQPHAMPHPNLAVSTLMSAMTAASRSRPRSGGTAIIGTGADARDRQEDHAQRLAVLPVRDRKRWCSTTSRSRPTRRPTSASLKNRTARPRALRAKSAARDTENCADTRGTADATIESRGELR